MGLSVFVCLRMCVCVCVCVSIVLTDHTLAKFKNVKYTLVDFDIYHRMA